MPNEPAPTTIARREPGVGRESWGRSGIGLRTQLTPRRYQGLPPDHGRRLTDMSLTAGIEVEGLVREFKNGPRAVDGIHLAVAPGEIYGFLGPNGAGKSTTVLMLTTLVAADGRHRPRRRARHPARGRGRARVDRRRAAGGRARPAADGLRPHAPADDAAGRAEGRAPHARRRAARARGLDRRGRPEGRRLLRRHEAPARSRARARPPPARAVPRRADHRPGPVVARGPVGRGRATGARGRGDRLPHHAVPGGGRRARRSRRDHRRRARSWPRARRRR